MKFSKNLAVRISIWWLTGKKWKKNSCSRRQQFKYEKKNVKYVFLNTVFG